MKMRGFKLFAAVLTATMLSVTAAIPAAAYPNTAGHWTQSGGKWYFLDEQGNTVYGWIYDNNSWYYFSPRWGALHSDWLELRDGRQYYFSTKHDGSFGKMLTGWQWIYGAWYYFGTAADGREGLLFTNETTPDGYRVDKDGKWIGQANASGDSRAAVLAAWPGIYYLNEDTYIEVFDVSAGGTIHFGRRILDASGEFPIYHEYTVPFTNAEMTEFRNPYQGGINEVFTLVDGGINATLEGGGRGADSGFYVKRR